MSWKQGDKIQCNIPYSSFTLAGDNAPEGYIAGVASTVSTDRHGHKVMAKAFDESIRQKGLAGPSGVQLLAGHNWDRVVGQIKKLETVNDKLLLEAQMNLDVTHVKDLHTTIKHNGGLNFSVGFALEEFEFNDVMEDENDPWLIVKRGDLMEVSIVTFPSQKDARMTFVKVGSGPEPIELETMAEFERAILADGLDGLLKTRNQAHKVALWASKNLHLLQPKLPLLVDKAPEPAHPLLDVNQLEHMKDLAAKMRAVLTTPSRSQIQ